MVGKAPKRKFSERFLNFHNFLYIVPDIVGIRNHEKCIPWIVKSGSSYLEEFLSNFKTIYGGEFAMIFGWFHTTFSSRISSRISRNYFDNGNRKRLNRGGDYSWSNMGLMNVVMGEAILLANPS